MENKKLYSLFGLVLILGLLFITGCASRGTSYSGGNVFTKVITLQYLVDAGIFKAPIDPIEGFTRILLLIVLFALLYKGATLLKLGNNIAGVIAGVFSLVTIIFIPGSVILAGATSWATIFSLIWLGLPIALGIWGYFFLKEHLWMRTGLMALLGFILYQMESHLALMQGGVSSSYVLVINNVVGWISAVKWIIYVFAGISLVQALFSLSTGTSGTDVNWKGIYNWVKRGERRKKAALMNEYIEEEKELKLMDDVIKARDEAVDVVNGMLSSRQIGSLAEGRAVLQKVSLVKDKITAAKNEFRRVKGRTWRQERAFDKLRKEFREKDKDVAQLDLLEKNLLIKHEEAITKLDGVLTAVEPIVKKAKDFEKGVLMGGVVFPYSIRSGKGVEKVLNFIKTQLTALDMKSAMDAQKEALKEVQGIITEARELMLWK